MSVFSNEELERLQRLLGDVYPEARPTAFIAAYCSSLKCSPSYKIGNFKLIAIAPAPAHCVPSFCPSCNHALYFDRVVADCVDQVTAKLLKTARVIAP